MQFLSGLDDSFNQVKSHILLMDPLPNVKTTFSIVSREESHHKNGALTSVSNVSKTQSSAFNSIFNDRKGQIQNSNKGTNQNLQCKNCGLKGHLFERCYKLIGYPKDFKPRIESNSGYQRNQNKTFSVNSSSVPSSSPSSSNASGNGGTYSFTSKQYNKLLILINERPSASEDTSVSANMAGANKHMTSFESLLQDTIDVSKLNLLVNHPNGSSAKIKKIGNLQFSENLTLFDVFVVPDFNVNILSVHKLCKDTNCEVVFNENCSKVQGLQSKKVVENGRDSGGLYYLDAFPSDNNFGGRIEREKRVPFLVFIWREEWRRKRKAEHDGNQMFLISGHSPYEVVFKKLPVFDHLRVFGCLCFATKLNNHDKLSERAEKCVLLGYSSEKKGYKLLSLDTNSVFVSRDVKFYELVFSFKLKSPTVDNQFDFNNSVDPFSYDDQLNSEYVNDLIDLNDLSVNHQMDDSNAAQNLDETFLILH
ncbi:uncharacterized protein LOC128133515 [Lactuca sativa]|uniref:uncharacterized protein LOC128133515 n=1 Tax=Lactuca sativa TaxID=4236 RepID=UPI0022AF7622|nr:uncharacterized protein LOC128133515 [Lactuca sativa]